MGTSGAVCSLSVAIVPFTACFSPINCDGEHTAHCMILSALFSSIIGHALDIRISSLDPLKAHLVVCMLYLCVLPSHAPAATASLTWL